MFTSDVPRIMYVDSVSKKKTFFDVFLNKKIGL